MLKEKIVALFDHSHNIYHSNLGCMRSGSVGDVIRMAADIAEATVNTLVHAENGKTYHIKGVIEILEVEDETLEELFGPELGEFDEHQPKTSIQRVRDGFPGADKLSDDEITQILKTQPMEID